MVTKREANKKHPQFLRPNYGRKSRERIGLAWRRPRGIDNKKRTKIAYMGASPNIGYGTPASVRHLHPTGRKEVLVHNMEQMKTAIAADVTGAKYAIRISAGVGKRKKTELMAVAINAKAFVLNPKI